MKIQRFILLAVLSIFSASTAAARDKIGLTLSPQAIGIGTFFNGTTVTATGSVPADSQVVIRFTGDTAPVHMRQKARVGGVVWMNLDSVTFEKAPSVCIVSSAAGFNELETGGGEGLGLAGLRQSVRVKCEGNQKVDVFAEFLKMKKKEGLYREISGNISYGRPADGLKTFRALIPLPSRLKPGTYTVEAVAVQNGGIISRSRQKLVAELRGAPSVMAALAFDHPILYGAIASFIAVIAGLGIGLVFQSKGAH